MSDLKIKKPIAASAVCQVSRGCAWGRILGIVLSGAFISVFVACRGEEQSGNDGSASSSIVAVPPASQVLLIPVGVPASVANAVTSEGIKDPYTGDAAAIAQGRQIMVGMNCVGCHGYNLKGGMGPDLTDTHWRYGGSPTLIFKSIYEGRPQGMPPWGDKLSPDVIWKVVAYIQSLGGALPARSAK